MLRILLVLTAVFLVYKLMPSYREISAPHPAPGVRVTSDPSQRDLGGAVAWTYGKYQITPLASYDIDAVVLSTEPYWLGRESELSPIDFAVAWGPMSDQAVIDQIHFAQGDRFLRFSATRFPLAADEINSHVANMHLVPATPEIAAQFKMAVHGQIVTMSGYLIKVDAKDGFHWMSSMSRTDRGSGACELMWVERFSVR